MTKEQFEKIVKDCLKRLPIILRDRLVNVEIVIEDNPIPQRTLLGLYQGVPLKKRGVWYGNVLPDKITLFKVNIEQFARTEDAMENIIYDVLLHEIGHYFGFDEEELRDMINDM